MNAVGINVSKGKSMVALKNNLISLTGKTFPIERYRKWCKRKGYNFSEEKAFSLYANSCGHITTLPKNDNTKLLIYYARIKERLAALDRADTTPPIFSYVCTQIGEKHFFSGLFLLPYLPSRIS